MSFFGDPSAIIAHIGSAIGSLAPAPAPQASFTPGQGAGSGGFTPAPMVAGSNAWPTVTLGGGGFQPAQMQGGTFQPAGALGGGFQPSDGIGGGFQPSGGIGGSPFSPTPGNPLLDPPKPPTASAPGQAGQGGQSGTPSTGLTPGVAQWADRMRQTFGDLDPDLPDVMLAIITNESGGDPNVQNHQGYPAYGLFQLWQQPGLSVDQQFVAARQLAQDKLRSLNDSYAAHGMNPDARTRARDFALAWGGQFNFGTGLPNPNSADVGSGQTAEQLANVFLGNYDKIKAGRQQPQSGAGIPAGPALQTIFGGGGTPQIMQEFGQTDYSQSHESTYTYGTSYGLPPGSHPGVDYAMPLGSNLYVPMDGTVTVVGNDHGTGYYYTSPMTGGDPDHSGELQITLANGDQIIMGHMSQIGLQLGQHVSAGTLAGLSGGSDGAHLHLEVRVKDPSMPSGYRIVDPRSYFGQR